MSEERTFEAVNAAFSKLAGIALARANAFSLLAIAFFDPTEEFAKHLVSGAYLSEVNAYFQDLTRRQPAARQALDPLKALQAQLAKCSPQALLHDLKVEYARLFIGPGRMRVPPYETFYGPKNKESQPLLMVSPAALAVETAYHEAGVAITNTLREPPDHFATECEFLYYLSKKESDAWAEGDNDAAKLWRRRQLAFLDGHLGKWGCEFCRRVEAESQGSFYQAAAHYGAALILLEGADSIQENGSPTEPATGS